MGLINENRHRNAFQQAELAAPDLGQPPGQRAAVSKLTKPKSGRTEAELRKQLAQETEAKERAIAELRALEDGAEADGLSDYTVITLDPDQIPRRPWDTSQITAQNINQVYNEIVQAGALLHAPILCRNHFPISGQTRVLALQKMKQDDPSTYHDLFPNDVQVLVHATADYDSDRFAFMRLALRAQKQRKPPAGKDRDEKIREAYAAGVEAGVYKSVNQAAQELGPLYGMQWRRATQIINQDRVRPSNTRLRSVKKSRDGLKALRDVLGDVPEIEPFRTEIEDLLVRLLPSIESAYQTEMKKERDRKSKAVDG